MEIRIGLLHPIVHGFQRRVLLFFLDAIAKRDGLETHGLREMIGDELGVDWDRRRRGGFSAGRGGYHQSPDKHEDEHRGEESRNSDGSALHGNGPNGDLLQASTLPSRESAAFPRWRPSACSG